jgi:hypothetical protein
VLTNHPIGGPVFAGEQTQPWVCTTEDNELAKAVDAQCNVPSKVDYLYVSTDPIKAGFQPYDPASPPSDVAETTTDQGMTVPFIVRRERGVIDRGIYEIVVLADPKQPLSPSAPPKAWNRKLFWTFGGDCKPNHSQPSDTSALNKNALGKGFAVADSGMTVLGKDCNDRTSAESVMMIKERIVESMGPIRYTMSDGCSGGSMQQHWIVSNYPGLVDGIQPTCSYPDIWETMQEAEDCHILDNYFTNISPAIWANVAQQDAVTGYLAPSTCHSFWDGPGLGYAKTWFDPTNAAGCSLPAEEVYDPDSNPNGVRCTLQDYMVGVFGRRPKDGFANRPYDNVGVQYGLTALNSGTITADQFIDLNQKVGGLDIDWSYTAERSVADPPALDVAYGAGLVTFPRAAATVPIIDLRGSSNAEIHTDFHSYTMRERLIQATGGPLADNILKCQLKPLDKSDYTVTFTDTQWAALQRAFPQGVCDYNRPGVSQRPSTPWMTFEDGPGGRPLGPAPASTPLQRAAACRPTRAVRLRLGRYARRVRSVVVTANGRRVPKRSVRLDRKRKTLMARIRPGKRGVVLPVTIRIRGAKPVRITRRIAGCGR